MVKLENESQRRVAGPGSRVIVERRDVAARKVKSSARSALQQSKNIEQRALARSRRPDQRREFSAPHHEIDAMQHFFGIGQSFVVSLAYLF